MFSYPSIKFPRIWTTSLQGTSYLTLLWLAHLPNASLVHPLLWFGPLLLAYTTEIFPLSHISRPFYNQQRWSSNNTYQSVIPSYLKLFISSRCVLNTVSTPNLNIPQKPNLWLSIQLHFLRGRPLTHPLCLAPLSVLSSFPHQGLCTCYFFLKYPVFCVTSWISASMVLLKEASGSEANATVPSTSVHYFSTLVSSQHPSPLTLHIFVCLCFSCFCHWNNDPMKANANFSHTTLSPVHRVGPQQYQ